jgi:hypothetical protein
LISKAEESTQEFTVSAVNAENPELNYESAEIQLD